MNINKLILALRENNNFLIATHLHPDGDGIGSELVFLGLLKEMGKRAVIVNETPLPSLYRFLPGSESIAASIPSDFAAEVAIILDTPTLARLGKVKDCAAKAPVILNIDHHISNTYFGNINWVRPEISSVAEQLFSLLKRLKLKIKPEWAMCLYTSILTDTGSFRYINTTPSTHRIAASLIECGARPHEIAQQIYESNSPEKIQFLARILRNVKITPDGLVAWATVPPYEKYENDEDLIAYPRSIKSVKIAMLFRSLKSSRVKISFRSKGDVDVNAFAQKFGGGGHRAASGCVIKGNLASVRKKIVEEALSYLKTVQSQYPYV